MKRLYILFDARCPLCQRLRRWMARQPAYVELRFIAQQSPEVECRFPGLAELGLASEDLVAISDAGDVYAGTSAYVTCLFVLCDYREWAQRLADPILLPLARRAFELLTENRIGLSRLLFATETIRVKAMLESEHPEDYEMARTR